MELILGIDPGSIRLGVGLIRKNGSRLALIHAETLTPASSEPFFNRLKFLMRRLDDVLLNLKPNSVAIESTFFGKNAHSAFQLGTARGVAIAACLAREIPIFEYAPAQVKSVVTGHGGSGKDQVRRMVEASLGSTDGLGFDATDALAIAICHASHVNWGRSC